MERFKSNSEGRRRVTGESGACSMNDDRLENLRDYIEASVADWNDDDVAFSRYSEFGAPDEEGRKEKMLFWKVLVLQAARHLGSIVISAEEVKQVWFLRKGVVPRGMDLVLAEMLNEGHLRRLNSFLDLQQSGWIPGIMALARKAWSILSKLSQGEDELPDVSGMLICMHLLQEAADSIHTRLLSAAGGALASDLVVTRGKFDALSGDCQQQSALVAKILELERRATVFNIHQNGLNVEGVKISPASKPVTGVTENDRQVLLLQHSVEGLQHRRLLLADEIASLHELAKSAAQAGRKKEAIRHLRRKRALAASLAKTEAFEDRLEALLASISDAETARQVVAAMGAGARIIQDLLLTVQQAQDCVRQTDEAMSAQREAQAALAGGVRAGDVGDAELEAELALLDKQEGEAPASADANLALASGRKDLLSSRLAQMSIAPVSLGLQGPGSEEGTQEGMPGGDLLLAE